MAETLVNELANIRVTASFFNYQSSAATPATVSWGVYDAIAGTKLSTGTETPATSVTIDVSSSVNRIIHNKAYERRRINVLATYSTGQQTGETSWLVKNLGFSQST